MFRPMVTSRGLAANVLGPMFLRPRPLPAAASVVVRDVKGLMSTMAMPRLRVILQLILQSLQVAHEQANLAVGLRALRECRRQGRDVGRNSGTHAIRQFGAQLATAGAPSHASSCSCSNS